MKELLGRLEALDPEASESLKVISYFDVLIDAQVGVESLLRGAATLSGATVGYRVGERTTRLLADGTVSVGGALDALGTHRAVGDDAAVWLERTGAAHTNDDIVLERLAIALTIVRTSAAAPSRRAVERLLVPSIDPSVDSEEHRLGALAALRIEPHVTVRALALRIEDPVPDTLPSAVIGTPWGLARGLIVPAPSGETPVDRLRLDYLVPHGGFGLPGVASTLRRSWRTALIALRLAPRPQGTVDLESFGVLLPAIETADTADGTSNELAALRAQLDAGWSVEALHALAAGESVRAVAAAAGLHHSTVQQRLPALDRALGYDSRSTLGRTRLYVALLLLRLESAGLS